MALTYIFLDPYKRWIALLFAALLTGSTCLSGDEGTPNLDTSGLDRYPDGAGSVLKEDFARGKALFLATKREWFGVPGIETRELRIVLEWGYVIVLSEGREGISHDEIMKRIVWCSEYNRALLKRITREREK